MQKLAILGLLALGFSTAADATVKIYGQFDRGNGSAPATSLKIQTDKDLGSVSLSGASAAAGSDTSDIGTSLLAGTTTFTFDQFSGPFSTWYSSNYSNGDVNGQDVIYHFNASDGSATPISLTFSPLFNSTGDFVGFLGYDKKGNEADFNVASALLAETPSAVPEPATWGMMLAGFGAVGGAMRASRRRQRVRSETRMANT